MSSFRVRKFLNSATSLGGQTNFTKKKYLPYINFFDGFYFCSSCAIAARLYISNFRKDNNQ